MLTIRPRAVSRVCRMALNWLSSWVRSSTFSACSCAVCLAALSSSSLAGGLLFASRRFGCGGASRACSTLSDPRRLRQPRSRLVFQLQLVRFGRRGSRARLIFALHAIRFRLRGRRLRILFAGQPLRLRQRRDARRFSFTRDAIGLGLRRNASALRTCFAIRRLLPLRSQGVCLLTFDGDGPRVFRGLYRSRARS